MSELAVVHKQNPSGGREDGIAMLEFVLMLPFIFLIIVLIFDFGQGLLERQRTLIAVRELAIRHSISLPTAGGNASIYPVTDQLATDTLSARHMTAEFSLDQSEAGTCPRRDKEAPDDGEIGDAMGVLGTFLKNISASHTYEGEGHGLPILGRVLPQPVYLACVAVDGNPWTIHETGGPEQWLKSVAGALGDFLSKFL